MRYGSKIISQICEELKKVPNIRYVCQKVGIDHSTFYRWLSQHFTFHQAIVGAMMIGRERINDTAENVIITGIMNGEFRSATYWLSHNHKRYVVHDRIQFHQFLDGEEIDFLEKETPADSLFEPLFKYLVLLEDKLGSEGAFKEIKPLVEIVCQEDQNLIEIFFSTFDGWKADKQNRFGKMLEAGVPLEEILKPKETTKEKKEDWEETTP